MKRILSLILALIMLMSLCACGGNFGSINLNDTIEIPENGIIKESIIRQIKNENAIGVFSGESNGFSYEWTIFGSDIAEAGDVDLGLSITKNEDGEPEIKLSSQSNFGFSALLSVHLEEMWDAQSATAYVSDEPIASVSLTGSKTSILNMTLDGSHRSFIVRPDALPEDAISLSELQLGDAEKTENEEESEKEENANGKGNYLSDVKDEDTQVYTGGKDKYLTDPVPEGKPMPVEPEDTQVNSGKTYTCTFSIECSTILNNLDMLDPAKLEMVPSGGVILAKTTVTFYEGESVFDVLQRLCKEKGIHMEAEWTPIYNSAYIEGIHNLYEFDCGALSGWMYKVNGWYPNYGCSRYQLKDGDTVEWRYTCDLGNDVGGAYAVGG